MSNEPHVLDGARHSAAHLLAAAVLEKYPSTKLGIGPTIENGFYYDFQLPDGEKITEEDFADLEERMKKIARENGGLEVTGRVVSEDEAQSTMNGQPFKQELITDFASQNQELTLYTMGSFTDLCRGGHVENTKDIPLDGLKLQSVAGAYWRGSEKNPMLTRVYGLLFANKKELRVYLALLEEAKKRDHRKIGREQELYMIDEKIGKGLPIWLPNGFIMKSEIEKLAIEMENEYGYDRVSTPHMAKKELFETSGHLPYYADSMYPPMVMDDGEYYLKAMNCPLHHQIYKYKPRSYRDLPLRLAEYGAVYRNELSGTLAGLMRVRGLEMNDAHIYCRKDQLEEEIGKVITLTQHYFEIFGLTDYWFRLSKWDPAHTDKYIDQPENWEFAQGVLREALEQTGVKYTEVDDEAAFYGPKIDVQFKSVLGKEETMSTIQLDFAAAQRFSLEYNDTTGETSNEVFVIHRAPLSTHERFIAFLIEHYGGVFPLWLAPVQVQLISVGEKHHRYCNELVLQLQKAGIRAKVDSSDETVGKKIRDAAGKKIPYMLVIGDQEMQSHALMVRTRGQQEAVAIGKDEFIASLQDKIATRSDEL